MKMEPLSYSLEWTLMRNNLYEKSTRKEMGSSFIVNPS
jgi:hypothetical protein